MPGRCPGALLGADPVVAHRKQHRIWLIRDAQLDASCVCMLEDVRHGLLQNAVGRQIEGRRQRSWLAAHLEARLETCLTRGVEKRLSLIQSRLRGQRRVGILAQDAEKVVELG